MTDELPAAAIAVSNAHHTLSAAEVALLRAQGVPVGFDPVLQGWVRLDDGTWRTARPERPVMTISFRPWEDADLPQFRELLSDPEVWRFLPEPFPGDLPEHVARDLLAVAQVTTFHEVRAAIWNGTPIGQVRVQWDTPTTLGAAPVSAEFSYWLGSAHWGRGFGRRIAIKSVPLAFARHSTLTSLWARVHPDNRASRRILGEAGFTATGRTSAEGWPILTCPRPVGGVVNRLAASVNQRT
jgi:RimJ/RimL family protein N-acetyltransferase